VGKKDPLANEIDTKWAWGEIQSKVENGYYFLDNVDHSSFGSGIDMSYVHTMIDMI
jgi:hypothetical protein